MFIGALNSFSDARYARRASTTGLMPKIDSLNWVNTEVLVRLLVKWLWGYNLFGSFAAALATTRWKASITGFSFAQSSHCEISRQWAM